MDVEDVAGSTVDDPVTRVVDSAALGMLEWPV